MEFSTQAVCSAGESPSDTRGDLKIRLPVLFFDFDELGIEGSDLPDTVARHEVVELGIARLAGEEFHILQWQSCLDRRYEGSPHLDEHAHACTWGRLPCSTKQRQTHTSQTDQQCNCKPTAFSWDPSSLRSLHTSPFECISVDRVLTRMRSD